jgi:DNA mismatch repair protein MutS2
MPAGEKLTPGNAALGKWVYVPSLRQKGSIIGIHGDEVSLRLGLVKTSLPMGKCLLATEGQKESPPAGRRRTERELSKAAEFRVEIDVRGKTVSEAILDLDKYIDDALLANVRQVRVIHGKGTGALRQGLLAYFKNHPSVRGAEMAALAEGGSGATVLFF